jgi:hypothetical protein
MSVVDRKPTHLITIGQLAAYAGVTIKAVRHYHVRGLLEEPSRDASGYRRYSAEHARAGDRLFVSAEAADYLDRLLELGVSQRGVQRERDGWILLQSVAPKEAAIWLADKREAIDDPEFRAIYLEYDAAFDWSPDDPRLHTLADRAERWMARPDRLKGQKASIQDPTIVKLVTSSVGASSPAWDRLTEIAKERFKTPPSRAVR